MENQIFEYYRETKKKEEKAVRFLKLQGYTVSKDLSEKIENIIIWFRSGKKTALESFRELEKIMSETQPMK